MWGPPRGDLHLLYVSANSQQQQQQEQQQKAIADLLPLLSCLTAACASSIKGSSTSNSSSIEELLHAEPHFTATGAIGLMEVVIWWGCFLQQQHLAATFLVRMQQTPAGTAAAAAALAAAAGFPIEARVFDHHQQQQQHQRGVAAAATTVTAAGERQQQQQDLLLAGAAADFSLVEGFAASWLMLLQQLLQLRASQPNGGPHTEGSLSFLLRGAPLLLHVLLLLLSLCEKRPLLRLLSMESLRWLGLQRDTTDHMQQAAPQVNSKP